MPNASAATSGKRMSAAAAVVWPLVRLALLVTLAAPASALAALAGRVVAVHDGDTITVLVERRALRVRLADIDAPEQGQPYASASRRALASRVGGRLVHIELRGRDGYGRALGVVYADGVSVNEAQVRDGWAWVFRRYASDASLLALEDEARRARRGLWREARPLAPWLWRDRHAPARIRGP